MSDATDLFRNRLRQLVKLKQRLAGLGSHVPWLTLEASAFSLQGRPASIAKKVNGECLLRPVYHYAVSPPHTARYPRALLRVLTALSYLQNACSEIDEAVVEWWSETPTWL